MGALPPSRDPRFRPRHILALLGAAALLSAPAVARGQVTSGALAVGLVIVAPSVLPAAGSVTPAVEIARTAVPPGRRVRTGGATIPGGVPANAQGATAGSASALAAGGDAYRVVVRLAPNSGATEPLWVRSVDGAERALTAGAGVIIADGVTAATARSLAVRVRAGADTDVPVQLIYEVQHRGALAY